MTLNPTVLVINCGSSSIKFSVLTADNCEAVISGIADGIGTEKPFCGLIESHNFNWLNGIILTHWLLLPMN